MTNYELIQCLSIEEMAELFIYQATVCMSDGQLEERWVPYLYKSKFGYESKYEALQAMIRYLKM